MKRSFKSKIISAALALLLGFGGLFTVDSHVNAAEDDIYKLMMFEVPDIHGYIAAEYNGEMEYRLACISDRVKDVRGYGADYRKEKAILIDTGDIYQGNTLSNLNHGQAMSAAYAAMDFDAVGIGNHEFDWHIETTVDSDKTMRDYDIGTLKGENKTPVICANLYRYGKKVDFTNDYVIVDKVATDDTGNEINVKVGIIGYADDYHSSVAYDLFTGEGYETIKDFSKVNEMAKTLEESGQCDMTILLYHGYARSAAQELGGGTNVDLVVGGHTHKTSNGVTPEGVKYIQGGCNGTNYCYAQLGFKVSDGKVEFVDTLEKRYVYITDESIRDRLHNLPENADYLDPDIIAITDVAIAEADEVLKEEIGYITESAYRYEYIEGSGDRSCTSGNWVTSMFMRGGNADVAIQNVGGLRKDIVVDGDRRIIKASDVYEMFPFDETLYVYEITYEELLEALKYSLTKQGKTLLSRISGIKCYFTGESVNAIETADGNVIYVDGKWKGDWKDRKLRLAASEYVATTQRETVDARNPLCDWNNTDKLLENNRIITDIAFEVLRKESAENNGHLVIEDTAYYLEKEIEDPFWYINADGVLAIQPGIGEIPEGKFKDYSDQKTVIFEGTAEQWYNTKIDEAWLTDSKDVTIECSDKAIVAASYICVKNKAHKWGEPVYTWADDNKKVTAEHTCAVCTEVESETADTEFKVTKEPTKTESGTGIYSVSFKNTAFSKQEKTVTIPATGLPDYSNEWIDGKWYSGDGTQSYPYTGSWKCNDKGWWYEDTSGWYPYSQWQKIDSKWYYFDAEGYMASEEWIDGYWLSENGAWEYEGIGSWHVNSKGWWFEDTLGWYAKSQWQKINSSW